jgi:thiamine biosynthesis lipoprotein ApbE
MDDVLRFMAMGTRAEVRVYGGQPGAAAAIRADTDAVDDALTIHRPSPTTALNDELALGREAEVACDILAAALSICAAMHEATNGWFDPAVDEFGSGWPAVHWDRARRRIAASRPLRLDFGGIGKGLALDRARGVVEASGATGAVVSLGDSSILFAGAHPCGGPWSIAVAHPCEAGHTVAHFEFVDRALSVSSSLRAADDPAAPYFRADRGTVQASPLTAAVLHVSGAMAEAISTALVASPPAAHAALLALAEPGQAVVEFHAQRARLALA